METQAATKTESANKLDLSEIKRKTKYSGKVLKTTLAGAVVDIGLEVPGVIHISQLQAKPTNRVEDVVEPGQEVEVWIKRIDPKKKRVELTMIEPLELEWREIERGMVVDGKVTRLEKFGAFVDIGAERPGLVHISEMTHDYVKTPSEVVKEGDEIQVQVLDVNRRKKQIKLSMKALAEKPAEKVEQIVDRKTRGKPKAEQEEVEKEAPVPTAMEMALREAMERSKDREPEAKPKSKRKASQKSDEIEDILERTLQNKVRSR